MGVRQRISQYRFFESNLEAFWVTIDELLSGDELLNIAEEDTKLKERALRDLIFGLLDCSMALLLFLPFFGQKADGVFRAVSLLALSDIQPYLKTVYISFVCVTVVFGIMTLATQNFRQRSWKWEKSFLSSVLSAAGVCLFTISQQPYAAVFVFSFLIIKSLMLIKRQ